MYNYRDLSDIEFEDLACDVMSKMLGIALTRFTQGRDGGIDLADNAHSPKIVVQVKHFANSPFSNLYSSLKKEFEKINKIKPTRYYIVCSCQLTPNNTKQIYTLFSDFMSSEDNIVSLIQIEKFLRDERNNDILTRHYKLWLCSIDVLNKLQYNDIALDSEVLCDKICNHRKYFVQTKYYSEAKDCLENNKVLMMIGEPGVGKSITSEMLALYFMELGYEIRYTTDVGNVSSLKRALSKDPKKKEFVYLDDCFGQCYFKMKETQVNELHSLIAYIKYSQNKILLLNSRVTIYKEAMEQNEEFSRQIEDKELKVRIIDMSYVAKLDKAKILYNHLFFSSLTDRHKKVIRENQLYRKIVEHKNYSPRIIEYITKESKTKYLKPEEYSKFILDALNAPEIIWQNEYDSRLQTVDRILLNVLYSLTDNFVPKATLKKCFNAYISKKAGIDRTIDNWRFSLNRLLDSFLQTVSYNHKMRIGVINPSVNDFLRSRITSGNPAYDDLVENINSVMQAYRLLKNPEEFLYKKIQNGEILDYVFNSKKQQIGYITYAVCFYGEKQNIYKDYVHAYLQNPFSDNIVNELYLNKYEVLKTLFNCEYFEFYELVDIVFRNSKSECVELGTNLFEDLMLSELTVLVSELSKIVSYFNMDRNLFIEMVCPYLQDALEEYDEIEAENIVEDFMITDLIKDYVDEDGHIDLDAVTYELEEKLEEKFRNDFLEIMSSLPNDVRDKLNTDKLNFYIMNVDQVVDEFLDDGDYDYDYYRENFSSKTIEDEIDYIFKKI